MHAVQAVKAMSRAKLLAVRPYSCWARDIPAHVFPGETQAFTSRS